MSQKSNKKRPKLKPKVATTVVRCPCCGEELTIEVSLTNMDFLIDEQDDEVFVKKALKKNGIEFG